MHELSIATSILKTAEHETEKIGGKNVVEIILEIGKLAGVELAALYFAWDLCMKNTVLEKAKLKIVETEGKAQCTDCGIVFSLEKIYDACPKCKNPFKEILQGKELKIKQLEIQI